MANADKIVVLDDGKVSEMGTPAELMKRAVYMHTLLNYSKENRKEILWNNTGS